MALNLLEKRFETNSSLAPKTVAEAVEVGYPISVLAKVSGMDNIYAQVEFDLIKSLALLNLNLTIKDHQYPFIVRELVDMFQNESIQDFQLCFKNGVKGKYGKIYNVDLSVLAAWMGEYLDEKYAYIENQNQSGHQQKEVIEDLIIEAAALNNDEETVQRDNSAFLRDKIIGSLSDVEVKMEGQERPYKKPYVQPDLDYVKNLELKREWGRRYHDLHTGKPLKDWISFEEFKKM